MKTSTEGRHLIAPIVRCTASCSSIAAGRGSRPRNYWETRWAGPTRRASSPSPVGLPATRAGPGRARTPAWCLHLFALCHIHVQDARNAECAVVALRRSGLEAQLGRGAPDYLSAARFEGLGWNRWRGPRTRRQILISAQVPGEPDRVVPLESGPAGRLDAPPLFTATSSRNRTQLARGRAPRAVADAAAVGEHREPSRTLLESDGTRVNFHTGRGAPARPTRSWGRGRRRAGASVADYVVERRWRRYPYAPLARPALAARLAERFTDAIFNLNHWLIITQAAHRRARPVLHESRPAAPEQLQRGDAAQGRHAARAHGTRAPRAPPRRGAARQHREPEF